MTKIITINARKMEYFNMDNPIHKIFVLGDSVKVITYPNVVKGLSFSSFATANDFIYTFKDLLEEAKPLL